MAVFLRTVLIQNRPEPADRTFVEDLPVNPLSQILVTLRGRSTDPNVATNLSLIYDSMPSIAIRYRGQDIIRGSLLDLAVLNAVLTGNPPFGYLAQDAANEIWTLTVPINFGRHPYDPAEAFPAVRRGDLTLEATVTTLSGNADLIDLQVETVELLDETPTRYLKYTTSSRTFTATGPDNVRLPIGNPLIGVLLRGTTAPVGTSQTATWEQIRTKVDNVETLYAATNWATLHGCLLQRISGDIRWLQDHAHRYDGTATGFANSLPPIRFAATAALERYAYLDFDPRKDGMYMLETAGRADVIIQRDVGTADLGIYIPVELVSIAGTGA